jgi:hypothetical protein
LVGIENTNNVRRKKVYINNALPTKQATKTSHQTAFKQQAKQTCKQRSTQTNKQAKASKLESHQ